MGKNWRGWDMLNRSDVTEEVARERWVNKGVSCVCTAQHLQSKWIRQDHISRSKPIFFMLL